MSILEAKCQQNFGTIITKGNKTLFSSKQIAVTFPSRSVKQCETPNLQKVVIFSQVFEAKSNRVPA